MSHVSNYLSHPTINRDDDKEQQTEAACCTGNTRVCNEFTTVQDQQTAETINICTSCINPAHRQSDDHEICREGKHSCLLTLCTEPNTSRTVPTVTDSFSMEAESCFTLKLCLHHNFRGRYCTFDCTDTVSITGQLVNIHIGRTVVRAVKS